MARSTTTTVPKPKKEPGRLKQMYQVFQMTRRYDSRAVWYMILAFVAPIVIAVVLAVVFAANNPVTIVLSITSGVLAGVLALLIVLGRRAERAAYSQIEGQPGAVGAVLKSSLRRGWTASELPVNVSPKTQDAVYCAIGPAGIVLIGEGPKSRTARMLDDERRRIARSLPNVPVNYLHVGPDSDSTPLHRVASAMTKHKRALNKAEIYAVSNRISSLSRNNLPIPKGIDPMRARAGRPR